MKSFDRRNGLTRVAQSLGGGLKQYAPQMITIAQFDGLFEAVRVICVVRRRTRGPAYASLGRQDILSFKGSALEWRNWQTHGTQNPALFTEHVGSTPTSSTRGQINLVQVVS